MKDLASLALVPALVCVLAGEGLAEESAPESPLRWYGWQSLLADGASLGTIMAGFKADSDMLAVAGVGGYLFAPVAIHAYHHNPGRAGASLLLRIAIPYVGMLLGASRGDGFAGFGEGMVGGMVTAVLVDAVMAFETVTPTPPPSPQPPTRSARGKRASLTSAGVVPTSNGARLVVDWRF